MCRKTKLLASCRYSNLGQKDPMLLVYFEQFFWSNYTYKIQFRHFSNLSFLGRANPLIEVNNTLTLCGLGPQGHFTHKLKACHHCNLRALIGWKGGDCPSSLHTQRWRPKGSKKISCMKSLHEVLHDGLWIRFHGVPEFTSSSPPRGGSDANSGRPWFFNNFSNRT